MITVQLDVKNPFRCNLLNYEVKTIFKKILDNLHLPLRVSVHRITQTSQPSWIKRKFLFLQFRD